MNHYEMFCVLPGTLAEAEVAPTVAEVDKILQANNAENIAMEDMGKSRLAYPIKNIRYGYFHIFRFGLEPENIQDIERKVRLLGGLLRVVVRLYDPAHVVSYKLAQDPTAPSNARLAKENAILGGTFVSPSVPEVRHERVEETKVEVADKKEEVPVVEVKEDVPVSAPVEPEKKEETVEPVKTATRTRKKEEKKKVSLSIDDIDQKLDEILQQDIDKV
ncbi:MAG: 30S ribosomal protein S6 [Candidatus Magasanikbacteria bacterium]